MRLPLAGGEGLTTRWAANEMLRRGCFDIIQPDVSICGGIAECLFIGELAQLSQVQCVPHCWAGAITLAATLHVVSLLPGAQPHAGRRRATGRVGRDRKPVPRRGRPRRTIRN